MIWMKALLLVVMVLAVSSADYCEQTADSLNYFLTPDETRVLELSKYIRGYDLQYTLQDAEGVKLYSSFSVSDKQDLNLKDYKSFKNVDVRRSPKANGMGFGAILAEKENEKEIAVWLGKFEGYNRLPDLSQFKFLALPEGITANCFDFRVADDLGGWGVLNCQTVPQTEEEDPQDLLCYITQDAQELSLAKNCKLFSSLYKSRARKTSILQIKGSTYVLSANTDLNDAKASVSYITVYYFNSKMEFVFNNIIDATSLDVTALEVADFVIASDNTIIVADSLSSRLILFSYSLSNVVGVKGVIPYPGRPLALAFDVDAQTLSVATKDVINEHNYNNPASIINKYEVDPSDGLVATLQTSKSHVAFTTLNKNLYVYERNQHKINYLLTKLEDIGDTQFVLSKQNSFIFSFAQLVAQSAYVAQPFLQISQLKADQSIKVTAKSTTQQCSMQLNLKLSADINNIAKKIPLEGKSFKVDPVKGLQIPLDSYFGGSDLDYKIPEQAKDNDDFTFNIKHMNQYKFTPTFEQTEASTILQLNPTSFYFIGVNTIKDYYVYVDICTANEGVIYCAYYAKVQQISKTKKAVESIKAERRSNGQSVVIWSYKYSGRAEYVYIQRKAVGFTDHSYPLAYTSLHITDSYFILVSKTGRYVSVLFENQPFYTGISESDFNADQLIEVQYFYPRQVYVDRSNANIFYVKLPTKIAKFHILDNHNIQYVGIVRDYGSYKLDKDWSINFDNNNIITYRDNTITEEYYNNADLKFTTTQQLAYVADALPIGYDRQSEISFIVSNPNNDGERTVKIMKPFQGTVDLQYSDLVVKGEVSVSGNWLLVNSETPSVYFIDKHPTLTVTSNIPEDTFKEDVTLVIEVNSRTQTEKSTTQIEGVNYPITIKNVPNNTVIDLPVSANNVEIKLPIESYFTGPVAYYSLSCPMCGGSHIHLYGPLRANRTIEDLPAVVDFVQVGDRVVAISFNMLILMNNDAEAITRSPIDKVSCTNLQYNQDIGLLVFCSSQSGQQILRYDVVKDHFFYDSTLVFHADTNIRNFDEMFAAHIGAKDFIFILDNDESVDSNNKVSTIKMYDITQDFTYVGEWTSKTFGTQQLLPINDFQIVKDKVFVTIGNFGIGYATLDGDGTLADLGVLELASIPDIKATLLDDSFFKQLEVLDYDAGKNEIKVFLTTTNSLSMVILLAFKDKAYSYKSLKESYYRYGNERLLNWHKVTADAIYLSYYSQEQDVVNLVYYRRSQNTKTHFTDGVLIRVSKNQLKYHEAFLINNKLITSHISDVPAEGQLAIYDVSSSFVLWLDYAAGGEFDYIDITAFNDYKQASHKLPVKFQAPVPPPPVPEPDGIKWYIVLIVCLSVLIAVGTAFGLFKYMKKKRAEKSVSLLTEREEDQEQEREKEKDDSLNDSTARDINRSSINATD